LVKSTLVTVRLKTVTQIYDPART